MMSKPKAFLLIFFALCSSLAKPIPKMARLKLNAQELLSRAIVHFKTHDVNAACAAFARQEEWRKGSVTLIVLSADGRIMVDEHQQDRAWHQYSPPLVAYGSSFMKALLGQATQGGWVAHRLFNSMRHMYVKSVAKDGVTYILGASFFDDSPELMAMVLANRIEHLWKRMGVNRTLDIVNNSLGSAVSGDVYGIVMDRKGICWAYGNNSLMIGQNLLDERSVGRQVAYNFKHILKRVTSEPNNKIWMDVRECSVTRRLYCQLFRDTTLGKEFVIMTGFYPDINDEKVSEVAERVATQLVAQGLPSALASFSRQERTADRICVGDLNFLIMNEQGIALYASAPSQTAYIGRNMLDYVDERRRPYNKDLMSKLEQADSAWITRFQKHSLERVYGRKIKLADSNLIIVVTGYYPHTEDAITRVLVEDACDHLGAHSLATSFNAFMSKDCAFVKGEKQIFVYDTQGNCWVRGLSPSFIWSKDKLIPSLAQGFIDDERSTNAKRMYLQRVVNKSDHTEREFIIGSSYYV